MGEPDEPPLSNRILSWATARTTNRTRDPAPLSSLPTHQPRDSHGLRDGDAAPHAASRSTTSTSGGGASVTSPGGSAKASASASGRAATSSPPAAPRRGDSEKARDESAALGPGVKPPLAVRARAGSKRFALHTKDALFHSWINVLLVFVPVGIALNWVPMPHGTKATVVFAMNAVAIIPLAGLLSHATESVASRMGDTWASLLNVTFGNAVELIIFIIALAKNEIRIVQASILGSILANLLLILGMAFVLGGLRFREQIYNSTVTQMSACLLSLSVVSLLLPTAFHASFADSDEADDKTTRISRGTSVVLLLIYVLYLAFQLKSHAYLYESTPQHIVDEESHPGILADLMNSSSDSSSSSSDGDSDSSSSSDSATTARKIRRVLTHHRRHRKSSASSVVTTANVSVASSPSNEKRLAFDDASPATHHDAYAGGATSGDEADVDAEPATASQTRIRDFSVAGTGTGTGTGQTLAEIPERRQSKSERKKDRKKRRRHHEARRAFNQSDLSSVDRMHSDEAAAAALPRHNSPPRVGFADTVPGAASTQQHSARPTAKSRPSFRPAMPSLLSNTVFTTPAPPAAQSKQPANLSVAHRHYPLRRTSSLPDRLNVQQSNTATVSSQQAVGGGGGGGAINEVDALRKDADEDADDDKPQMSRTAAVMLLLISTGLVAFCAELLVDAIPEMIDNTSVSQAFIGLIILPIVGNAAEHVTAVTVATKNKMDLAIGVAVGSSIQIALFVTPFVVLLGWIMGKEMSLYFNLFETVSLFVTAFVVNFLVLDGRSNYLEGSLLIAAYVIIALAAFYYPNEAQQSALGGGTGGGG